MGPRPKSNLPAAASGARARAASGVQAPAGAPRWRGWAAAVAGGVAGALAFDPAGLRPLIVLAPLGCFLAIRWAPSPRGALLRAWAFGWVYFFGALQWLLSIRVWTDPQAIGVLAVIALAAYAGLYPALVGLTLRKWFWTRCASRQFIFFGALWLLAEWVRTLGKMAMPMAQLGHAWATIPWAIQIASVLGELGVSLEVLYLAGLIFLAGRWWTLRRSADKAAAAPALRRLGRLIPALGAVAILFAAASHYRVTGLERSLASPTFPHQNLNVALVQPNIDQLTKLVSYSPGVDPDEQARANEYIRQQTEGLVNRNARGQYDLILLPETAYTELRFNLDEPLKNHISDLVRASGADMLVSASRWVSAAEFYNTAYFVHKDGQFDAAAYDKMRLVPFGEGIPYNLNKLPGVQTLVPIDPFSEGVRQPLFTTRGAKFGVLICFESTFSSLARELVRKGADFLTVVTNDAWYGLSAGAANHHNLSLLRAVETRRWLLRCANTGISSIITPAGTIQSSLGPGRLGVVQGTIVTGLYPGRTLFVVIGNGWLALPLLALAWGALERRRAARSALPGPAGNGKH